VCQEGNNSPSEPLQRVIGHDIDLTVGRRSLGGVRDIEKIVLHISRLQRAQPFAGLADEPPRVPQVNPHVQFEDYLTWVSRTLDCPPV